MAMADAGPRDVGGGARTTLASAANTWEQLATAQPAVVTVLRASGDGDRRASNAPRRRNAGATTPVPNSSLLHAGRNLEVDNSGARTWSGRPPSPSLLAPSQPPGDNLAHGALIHQQAAAAPASTPPPRRSVPIVHPSRSPSPRHRGHPAASAGPVRLPQAGDGRRAFDSPSQGPEPSQMPALMDRQNCDPNSHAEAVVDGRSITGKHARDMRGRLSAFLQNSAGSHTTALHPGLSPPLKPYWCQDVFSSSPIRGHVAEGQYGAESGSSPPPIAPVQIQVKSKPTRRGLQPIMLGEATDEGGQSLTTDSHFNGGHVSEQTVPAAYSSGQADSVEGRLKQATPSLEPIDIQHQDTRSERARSERIDMHDEREEMLRAENLGLRQRVMALELVELQLQTDRSNCQQSLAELERALTKKDAALQRLSAERDSCLAQIQELSEKVASRDNLEDGERWLELDRTNQGQEVDDQAAVLRDGSIALLESQLVHCNRQLARRDTRIMDLERQVEALEIVKHGENSKKIAELTREVEVLEVVKNGKQLSEIQDELARVQGVNDELRKQIFDMNVRSAREENRLQDACSTMKAQDAELVALRARRKEIQRALHAAHRCAADLKALAEASMRDCAETYQDLSLAMRELWQQSNGGTTLAAAASLILELSVNGVLCDAMVQTQPWDRLSCAECGGEKSVLLQGGDADTVQILQELLASARVEGDRAKDRLAELERHLQHGEDADTVQILQELLASARAEGDRAKDRLADLERRYSGLETTMEWLTSERDSSEQKCTDLQLMCVAYREKIDTLDKTISSQQDSLSANAMALDERDTELEKFRAEIASARRCRQQQEEARAADEATVQARETEARRKVQAAEAALEKERAEFESRIQAADKVLTEEQARMQILEADNNYQNKLRREAESKLESQLRHSQDNASARAPAQGVRSLEFVPRDHLHGAQPMVRSPTHTEIGQVLANGRGQLRSLRALATDLESTSARIANELNMAHARAQRLQQRLGEAERARIAAEANRERRAIVGAASELGSLAAEVEVFRKVAMQGDVNKLVAMYEMAKEEARVNHRAAGEGMQVVQALHAQRIATVELEAKISLLEEAKAAAESELAVAQRIMAMRAAVDRQGGFEVGNSSSTLSSGLAAVEDLLHAAQRGLPSDDVFNGGGGNARDMGGDIDTHARVHSTFPLVRVNPQGTGGMSRGAEYEPEAALLLVDREDVRRPSDEGPSYPDTGKDVGRIAWAAGGWRESIGGLRAGRAASDVQSLSASLPVSMARNARTEEMGRAEGNGHSRHGQEMNWGVRSGGVPVGLGAVERLTTQRESSPWAQRTEPGSGGMGPAGSGGDAWQRTMEIRKMLGR